jgi:hypothetical protein
LRETQGQEFWGLYQPAPTGYDIFIRESAILGNVMTSSHLALLENRCSAMLEKLRAEEFLSAESHQEVAAALKAAERKDWPQKSDGCEDFVSQACKGKCDYSPLLAKVASSLAANPDVPKELSVAISAAKLSDEQRADRDKAWVEICLPRITSAGNRAERLSRALFET